MTVVQKPTRRGVLRADPAASGTRRPHRAHRRRRPDAAQPIEVRRDYGSDRSGCPGRHVATTAWLGPGPNPLQARRPTFDSHDELECYWPLGDRRGLFAMAWRRENLFGGGVPPVDPRPSPPGVVLRFRPPGLGGPRDARSGAIRGHNTIVGPSNVQGLRSEGETPMNIETTACAYGCTRAY